MKKILIASIALILPSVILSSSLNTKNINDDEWNVKFELPSICLDFDVIKLEDGYMILSGWPDIWLTKLDKRGNLMWKKCVSSENRDLPAAIVELEDGFAIGGYTEKVDDDLFLIKTDKSGELLWRKTYGEKGVAEYGGRVIKVRGGFLLVGEQDDIFWVLKVDEEGNEIWNRTFFEKGNEWGEGCDALEIEDGYLLLGLCYSNGRIGLVKVDENGNEIWNKTYSRGAYEGDATIIKIEDGYLIGGWGDPGSFLLKIDKEGNKIWYKNYLGGDILFKDIGEVEDGYAAVGYWQIKNIGGFDILLLKVDKNTGYPIWYKNFGGRDDDFGYRLLIENKSYFIFGEYGKRVTQRGKGVMIKCADYAPPEINITRPRENYLYIFDREIMPYDYTFVIGKITIEAEVYNPSNAIIKRIEFYIDRNKEYTYEPVKILYSPPYQWTVDMPVHGWITLTAGLYYGDAEGVIAVEKGMRIIKLI